MKENRLNLKVGDSVAVKSGTKDPDTGGDITGWQGRITEFAEYEGETWEREVCDSAVRSGSD
ncbi:MAG: hypothetical protein L0226_04040 [Acidobacteria bacterium]|nr:hypothetical protein [Acidobacteriota bacterium]